MIKEEWNKIIAAKLKEGVSIEDLKHDYGEGVVIEPNVWKEDTSIYSHTLSVEKPWVNMASISGGSSSDKNALALQSLQQGANGLSIQMNPEDSIIEVLKDIQTQYLDVRIDCAQLSDQEVATQKGNVQSLDFPNIRWSNCSDGHEVKHIGKENRVNEIKKCLSTLTGDWNVDIVVNLSKKLLFEVASLRAIRALVQEIGIQDFHIVCTYDIEGTNELGDYNLIEKTYKVISAILGGGDAVLTPYEGDEDSRLSLNIHNVLDLESSLKSVMDPLGGAYYIEKLTGEIIEQVKKES